MDAGLDDTRAQAALRRAALAHYAARGTRDAVLVLDEQDQVRYANRRARRMAGDDGLALEGRELAAIVPAGVDGQRLLDAVSLARGQGRSSRLRVAREGRRELRIAAHPIHEPGARGVLLVVRTRRVARVEGVPTAADLDPLTGLVNRRGFERALARLLRDVEERGGEHALCYLDLDDFKIVNDSCGHAAGDALLRQLPGLLDPVVREGDVIARLGGDEFGVLLRDCSLENAGRVAEALRDAVRGFRFAWQTRTFSIGVGIGVTAITQGAEDADTLLRDADTACYTAKETGRNIVHVAPPRQLAVVRNRGERRWAQRLRSALDEDEGFELHYQSLHRLGPGPSTEGEARHHELLLRLRDAEGQPILPGAFLSTAARHGLMPQLDRWVIRHGLAQVARLLRGPAAGHVFSLNISGRSLGEADTLATIREVLAEHALDPAAIAFEVQETAASLNLGAALHFMRELKALGCRLVLDDFGSGVSSFSYLKNLPVDLIKIDGSIVQDLLGSRVDEAIVRACNDVAHCLGIATVAESVESDAQLALLREMGLNYAQGFVYDRPRPLAEFAAAPEAPLLLQTSA